MKQAIENKRIETNYSTLLQTYYYYIELNKLLYQMKRRKRVTYGKGVIIIILIFHIYIAQINIQEDMINLQTYYYYIELNKLLYQMKGVNG